jgi:acylphosphatase
VEVLACGDEQRVKELCDWLWHGPPAAKVSNVQVSDAECSDLPAAFSIL